MTDHERTIEQTLAAAYRKHGQTAPSGVMPQGELDPAAALLERESDALRDDGRAVDRETLMLIRKECFYDLLEFLFLDGPHPSTVTKRVYSVAKAFRSDLILHMSVRDLAKLTNESHGAWSWRVKQVVGEYVKARTGDDVRLPWQKSDEARAKYAAAQQGNRNRRTSTKGRG